MNTKQEWWNDEKYWSYDGLNPDIPAILAEHEKKVLERVRGIVEAKKPVVTHIERPTRWNERTESGWEYYLMNSGALSWANNFLSRLQTLEDANSSEE